MLGLTDLKDPTMLRITANGSGRVGDLAELETLLKTEPLDITFERYGNFVLAGEAGVTRFWGNFSRVSHVFQIDTDESEVVARLTAAIRANQATSAYLAQRPTPPVVTPAQKAALLHALAANGHHGDPCGLQRKTKARGAYLEHGGRSRDGRESAAWRLTDEGRAAATALRAGNT